MHSFFSSVIPEKLRKNKAHIFLFKGLGLKPSAIIPVSAKPTDRIFLSFAPPRYEARFVAIEPESKPLQRLASLVARAVAVDR